MPRQPLPAGYRPGSAHMDVLPADSLLWRLHDGDFAAVEFTPPKPDPYFAGNRFDGTPEDPFTFHYSAEHKITALAEVLLRGRRFEDTGERLIPFVAVAGRMLSPVETTMPLRLVRLVTAEDMAAVCQDEWLFEADDAELIQTRQWVRQLRAAEPGAQGLVWASRRDRPRPAYVLFGDRCGDEPLRPAPAPRLDLACRADVRTANELLKKLNATIVIPHSLG